MNTSAKDIELNTYRLLGNTGLRVSPVCLGTMTFGESWGWGSSYSDSQAVLDYYLDCGGNFIDTANYYTNGESEEFLGRLLTDRRRKVVLATKYTLVMDPLDPNSAGSHRKSLKHAVEDSLRRLKTDYIDLLWVHAWDNRTPTEELLRSLDDLVSRGQVLYLGYSDIPAWKIAETNAIAKMSGLESFQALQLKYSLAERSIERELIPYAKSAGLSIVTWGALHAGVLSGKYHADLIQRGDSDPLPILKDRLREVKQDRLTPKDSRIVMTLGEIARELSCSLAEVALAWLLSRSECIIPIIGARTIGQLKSNLAAWNLKLSPGQLSALSEVSAIELGFPHDFLASPAMQARISGSQIVQMR